MVDEVGRFLRGEGGVVVDPPEFETHLEGFFHDFALDQFGVGEQLSGVGLRRIGGTPRSQNLLEFVENHPTTLELGRA